MTTDPELREASDAADKLAQEARELPRDARSALLYAESCCVDYGGLLEGVRMNAEDHEALRQFQAMGLLTFGRIPAALLGTHGFTRTNPTHWCRLNPKGWTLAHLCRMIRAEQVGPYATEVFAEVAARAAGEA